MVDYDAAPHIGRMERPEDVRTYLRTGTPYRSICDVPTSVSFGAAA
jgi:hypothetical protein